MVKNLYLVLFAVAVIAASTSCEKDDDIRNPDPIFTQALESQYPDAGWVEWEKKYGYVVAEFWHNGSELNVWYDSDASWEMTETDLGRDKSKLPTAVVDTFENSGYASWNIDDLDMYSRPDGTYYLIEIEKNGDRDRDLYFSEQGTLLSDTVEKSEFLPTSKF